MELRVRKKKVQRPEEVAEIFQLDPEVGKRDRQDEREVLGRTIQP